MSEREWAVHGSQLGRLGRNVAWWIGDWLNYGNAVYGDRYRQAAGITGYDKQTLMNMVYVSSRFKISRRRENLRWSHHAELAACTTEDQDAWLSRAASEKLSVHRLRDELRWSGVRPSSAKARRSETSTRPRQAPSAVAPLELTCPHCGQTFHWPGPDDVGQPGDAVSEQAVQPAG